MKKFLAFLLIMILGAGAYLYSATDGFRRNVDVQKDVVDPGQNIISLARKTFEAYFAPKTVGIADIDFKPVEDVSVEADPDDDLGLRPVAPGFDQEADEIVVIEEDKADVLVPNLEALEHKGPPRQGKELIDILKVLVEDLAGLLGDYSQKRERISQMVTPESVRDSEIVVNNIDAFNQIHAELSEKADAAFALFEKADAQVDDLVSSLPEDKAEFVNQEWAVLLNEHAVLYRQFFETEGDALAAHKRLMNFYANRAGAYTYDERQGEIAFAVAADEQIASHLRRQLNRAERSKKRLMSIKGKN